MNELAKNPEAAKAANLFHAPLQTNPMGAEPVDPITALILRAATDPTFDASKFETLMKMQAAREAVQAKAGYAAALVAVKPKLPVIEKNGNITIKEKGGDRVIQSSEYALYEDIDEAITPILAEHGLVLTFRGADGPNGKLNVTGILTWSNGTLTHSEEMTIPLPHDSTGSKNAVQAVGSTMSYGKRYAAILMLNIRIKGQDDDGHAGGSKTISEDQLEKLQDMIAAGWPNDPGYTERFCLHLSKLTNSEIRSLRDIPAKAFDDAVITLNTAERRKAQNARAR